MFLKEDRFETYFDKHTQYSKPQLGSVSILEVTTAYRFQMRRLGYINLNTWNESVVLDS